MLHLWRSGGVRGDRRPGACTCGLDFSVTAFLESSRVGDEPLGAHLSHLSGLICGPGNEMTLPLEASPILGGGGDGVPVCIKDYASSENILEKVDPVFAERRFNPVPVRIIIDKDGKVKHIHFLSAFPDQEKAITDALFQWRFRPFLRDGKPVEVETGILFGRAPRQPTSSAAQPVSE